MKRSLLLVLSALLAIPAMVITMDKPLAGMDPKLPLCQGVTLGKDKVITHTDGHQYTLFYFYDSVYAYQVVKNSKTKEDVICVFSSLDANTTPAENQKKIGSANSHWSRDEFDTLRDIAAKRGALHNSFNFTDTQSSGANHWLSKKTSAKYQTRITNNIRNHDEAIRVALRQGRDGLPELTALAKIINQTHTDLMHDIRMAQLKFYALMSVGTALVVSGLYAGYQWYFGAQAEDDLDENVAEATDDTTAIKQEPS